MLVEEGDIWFCCVSVVLSISLTFSSLWDVCGNSIGIVWFMALVSEFPPGEPGRSSTCVVCVCAVDCSRDMSATAVKGMLLCKHPL